MSPVGPLLDIALDDERFRALADAAREGGAVPVHMSGSIRPYLLAALVEAEEGLGGRPALVVAADDIGARDLARELGAYLAPRRVRYYPSRGTGYASHLAPPPHLVGPADRGAGCARRTRRAGGGRGERRRARRGGARRLAAPGGLHARPRRGGRPRRGRRACWSRPATSAPTRSRSAGQFAIRGGILDVFPATEDRAARLELFGDEIESIRWFSTFTQRSLGEAEQVELSPAAELASEHRELAELALRGRRGAPGRRRSSCRSTRSAPRST